MANAFYLTAAVCEDMLNNLLSELDASGAAIINIYAGTVPASADATNTGTLLATLTADTTAGSVTDTAGENAVLTFNAISPDTSAAATGTASFFQITDGASTPAVICQGTVGTSDCDMNLNTTAITSGSEVSVTSATITLPVGPG